LDPRCDLRCRMCGYWQGIYEESGRQPLATGEWMRLFDAVAARGARSLVMTGGEPFLRSDLLELVEHGRARFPFVRLQTNGLHLTAERVARLVAAELDVLWVSLDGVRSVHDRIRGQEGAFAETRAGLERLMAARRAAGSCRPALQLNVTVQPENVEHLEP